MKLFVFLSTLLLATQILFNPSNSKAEEEKSSWLREKIKSRIIKKNQDRPAPVLTPDIPLKIEKSGNYTLSILHNKIERFYILHVPENYNSKTPTPLIFSLHGGAGDMNIQSSDKYYKLISKADKEGFIIIFPNGYSQFNSGKIATWNAGACCAEARDTNSDDVGFIKKIFERTSNQLNIDTKKVFSIGMSNGGMMSYRLACELSDIFKSIASVAGSDNTISCNPKNPISILHIHAKNDDRVLFNGGAGNSSFRKKSAVTDFKSVPDTIKKWVKLNNCDPIPKRVLQNTGAYCDRYSKCTSNTEVQLCVTESGGHSWPGGKKPTKLFGESPSDAISANDIIWDFFKDR